MRTIREGWRVASPRLRRHCDACELKILPGDLYEWQDNADGGDRATWRAHEQCARLLTGLLFDARQGKGDVFWGHHDALESGCLRADRCDIEELPQWWQDWRAERKRREASDATNTQA
jgi:hypothetical protein